MSVHLRAYSTKTLGSIYIYIFIYIYIYMYMYIYIYTHIYDIFIYIIYILYILYNCTHPVLLHITTDKTRMVDILI